MTASHEGPFGSGYVMVRSVRGVNVTAVDEDEVCGVAAAAVVGPLLLRGVRNTVPAAPLVAAVLPEGLADAAVAWCRLPNDRREGVPAS